MAQIYIVSDSEAAGGKRAYPLPTVYIYYAEQFAHGCGFVQVQLLELTTKNSWLRREKIKTAQ